MPVVAILSSLAAARRALVVAVSFLVSPSPLLHARRYHSLLSTLYALLSRREAAPGIALVLIDHVWMPSPGEYFERLEELLTADFLPIRLLGDRYAIERETSTWNRTVVDREGALAGWARVIRRAMEQMLFVSAFANNHYAGYAPESARRLAEIVLGTAPPIPGATKASGSHDKAAEVTLFDEMGQ